MLEKSPKQHGIGKNKRGIPHAFVRELVRITTRATQKREPSQPRSKYSKTIKYNTNKPR